MDILPPRPLNRRAYRAVGAEVRRMDRGARAAVSADIVIPLLDRPPKNDEAQRYAPFMNLLGRAIGDERLVQSSRTPTASSINRANNLAGMTAKVVGVMSGSLESRLSAVATPTFAPIIVKSMEGLKKHGMHGEEALAGALALGFFEGIVAQKSQVVSPQRDGYEAVLGRVLGAMDRKQQLSGLGVITTATRDAVAKIGRKDISFTTLTDAEREAYNKAHPFGLVYAPPLVTSRQIENENFQFYGVAGVLPYGFINDFRNLATKTNEQVLKIGGDFSKPMRERFLAWVYLVSPPLRGSRMNAFDSGYFSSTTKYTTYGWEFEGKTKQELADIVRGVSPVYTQETDREVKDAMPWKAVAILYRKMLEDAGVCTQNTIRKSEDWIVNTQCAVDSQTCRDDKIRFVTNALKRVLGREPTVCDINYYTRFGVGPDTKAGESWDDFIRLKESQSRPEHSVDDINAGGAGQTLDYLFNWVIDLVKTVADFASNILCRVFKAIFGKEFGGIICQIIDFLLKLVTGVGTTLLAVMRDVLKMFAQIGEALALRVDGVEKTMRVLMAIAGGLNNIVMDVLGTTIAVVLDIPVTDSDYQKARQAAVAAGKDPADVLISVQMLSSRLTQKQPMFAITFISSIIGLGSSVFGGLKGLATGIAGVLNASADAMGVLLGQWVRAKYTDLKGFALDTVESGIAVLTKILGTVVAGVLTLYDMFDQMKTKYSTWLASDAGKKVAGAKSWADVRKPFWASCVRMWSIVQNTANSLFKPPPPNQPGGLKALMIEFGVCVGIMAIILIAMAYSPDPEAILAFGTELVASAATTVTGVVLVTEGQFSQLEKDIGDSCAKLRDDGKPMPALCAKVRVPEVAPPDSTPPDMRPPDDKKPPAKSKLNLGPALALAAGGALVGGPIGAAGGFIIGFVGALPKKGKV